MKVRDLFVKNDQQPASKAERRAAGLPTAELMNWADTSVIAVGRALDRYRNSGQVEDIIEAESSAQVVQVMLAEMRRRARV